MKIQKEELGNSQVQLTVEVEAARLEQAKKQAVRHAAQHVQVPGFRKGKAPANMIIRTVGEPAILEEAIEHLLPDTLEQAVKESETRVYSFRDVEANVEALEPLTFRFVVPVMPTIKLGNVDDVSVEVKEVTVSDEQVEEVIQNLRKQRGIWEPTLGPALLGDRATLDLRGDLMDGSTVVDQKGVEMTLLDANVELDEEFENEEAEDEADADIQPPDLVPHLIGMMVNQVKEFPLVYPEAYPETRMAGRTVLYRATMLDLKRQGEVALDDEFAQSLGDFSTVDDLRARVRDNMLAQAEDEAFNQLVEEILDALADESELEYPQAMIQHEVARRVERLQQQIQSYGLEWSMYLTVVQKTQEEIEDELRDTAEEFIRRSLTLMEYATANTVEPTEEEIERETEMVLRSYGPNALDLRERIRETPEAQADIINSLVNRKAINHLYTAVTGEEAPPLFPEETDEDTDIVDGFYANDDEPMDEEVPAETLGEPAQQTDETDISAGDEVPYGELLSASDGVPESATPREADDTIPVEAGSAEPSDDALSAPDGVPEE